MRVFGIQLRKELRDLWHTRKLLIVLLVLIAFGLMSPILAKITPDLIKSLGENQSSGVIITLPTPTAKDAIDQFVKNITQFGLLLAILMSFNAIVSERERGQAALMFAHPLPRTTFVLAKLGALAIMFGLGLILSGVAAYLYTAILFKTLAVGRFAALVILMYVWLLSLVSLSLLGSTLGRSVASAGGIAFVFVLIVLLSGMFTTLAPGELLGWGSGIAAENGGPARWGALIVTLVIVAGAAAANCAILQRQEIGS